jgi:hypothetical protein
MTRIPPQYPTIRELCLAGSAIPFAFLSDEIDGQVDQVVYDFPSWPSMPGFVPIDAQVRGIWTFLQATSVATPPTISIGTNSPDFNNMLANTAALPMDASGCTAFLGNGGGGPALGASLELQGENRLPDLTTPPRILLSDPIVGVGFGAALFRVLVIGYVARLPEIIPG